MPRYDPYGHPLLSLAARRLGVLRLAAEADAAESVLGRGGKLLADTDFANGSPEEERATLAVVYQINYQLEGGTDAEVYGSQTRGARTVGFRGGVLNPMPVVSARAQRIVDTLIGAQGDLTNWPLAGGLR